MAKQRKETLYFLANSEEARNKIEQLCKEFPEIKITGIREETDRKIIYYDIKYPIKIRNNINLYLSQHKMYTI